MYDVKGIQYKETKRITQKTLTNEGRKSESMKEKEKVRKKK